MKHLRHSIALLLALPAFAQTVSVRVVPPNPVVADEVRLEFEVKAPHGARVELPDTPGPIDCARVVDRETPRPNIVVFVLDPDGPGTCHVPPIAARVNDATIASSQLQFPVASLIPPNETLPDIRDTQEPLDLPSLSVNWWAIAAGALAIFAVVAWFTFSGRRPVERSAAYEPPEVRARRRLDALAAERPADPREFYAQLGQILRAYLDDRLRLRSTRCTSSEVLAAVQSTGLITPLSRDLLEALLADCDYAKFSLDSLAGGDPAEAFACCRKIIEILAAQAASRPRFSQAQEALTHA